MTTGFERRWRERFAEFAELRDDDAGIAGWSESGLAARFRRFTSLWGDRRTAGRWLDAGCGAATYSRFLATRGANVLGADYSLPSLIKARDRGAENIGLLAADVTKLPLRSAAVDGALCFGVTQALSHSADAVNELARCLAPGGELWIDGLNRYCIPNVIVVLRRRLQGKPRHLRYESPRALLRAMHDAKLEHVELHWMPIMPAALKGMQPWLESRFARTILRYLPPVAALVSHAFIVTGRKAAG